MIISVEDRFDNLYNELKRMGYEVYRFSEQVAADVVVYSGHNTHLASLNKPELSNSRGIFLINGDYKNASEIAGMVEHKTYSSLF